MLRFLLDEFRQAPGPLKQTRLILCDIAEELIDLSEHYLGLLHPPAQEPGACSSDAPRDPESRFTPQRPDLETRADEPSPPAEREDEPPSRDEPPLPRATDIPSELTAAIDDPDNRKKQEFKVLAILWDAERRGLGPLSAKAVSESGQRLGLAIRHENVRKVIRLRLSRYIEVRTLTTGNTSIYAYAITPKGIERFASEYLGRNPLT